MKNLEEDGPQPDDSPKASSASAYREFAPFLGLGIQLAVAVVVFYFAGSWLDERYGSSPLWSLVGVGVGTVGGLIKFVKTALGADTSDKKDQQSSSK
jgi:hypothetical protein